MERAVVRFTAAEQPPLNLGIDATLDAHDPANAIPFDLVLRLDDVLRQARLQGKLTPATRSIEAEFGIDSIRGAGLARFLPPQLACTLTDGSFQMRLAAVGAQPGGTGGSIDVTQVRLTDRGQELVTVPRLLLGLLLPSGRLQRDQRRG